MSRAHGRTTESPGGVQASFELAHRVPRCHTADRSRSSLVSMDPGAPGWSAAGGTDVGEIGGSDSAAATSPDAGAPVMATTPRKWPTGSPLYTRYSVPVEDSDWTGTRPNRPGSGPKCACRTAVPASKSD